MQDREKISTGPNAEPIDENIAGTAPGIPDDALAPGEEELPKPPTVLDRLSAAIGEEGCALAESGGEVHPVCGLWRSSDLERAEDYAASGRRSLKGLAAQLGFVAAEWPAGPEDPFFNVNSSEDLAEAARRS